MTPMMLVVLPAQPIPAPRVFGQPLPTRCESRFCVNRTEPVFLGLDGVALCGVCRRMWHQLMVRKALEIRRRVA